MMVEHGEKAGFVVPEAISLRPHYVKTLGIWADTLEARKPEVLEVTREIGTHLMDGVEMEHAIAARAAVISIDGVRDAAVRGRWMGRSLIMNSNRSAMSAAMASLHVNSARSVYTVDVKEL